MKFNELPESIQQRLNDERLKLSNRVINNAYEVLLYNLKAISVDKRGRTVARSW